MDNSIRCRLSSICKTTICLIVFIICVQPLAICCLMVSIIRMIWRNVLIVKYPKLEFVKRQNLRSLSDTPRNQGIVNVILHLEGEYNVNVIKETLLSGVLQRRNKSGDYCFPKLRSILVTCWGYYAWKTQAQFNINNQVTLHPSSYRGRPVTEANVQDYISSIVSKYLPPEQPPWHICIVPLAIAPSATTRAEEAATADVDVDVAVNTDIDTEDIPPESSSPGAIYEYYIIVRMHHLLLSEEPDLRLNELLQIESFITAETADVRPIDADYVSSVNGDAHAGSVSGDTCDPVSVATTSSPTSQQPNVHPSPLANILDCPTYIPQLYFRIRIVVSNLWNEFICNYDPSMECGPSITDAGSSSSNDPDSCSNVRPTYSISTLMAAILISFVTVIADFFNGYHATQSHPLIKVKFFTNLVKREIRKRAFSWSTLWQAAVTTLNPAHILRMSVAWVWWTFVTICVLWPYWAYRELVAFRCCAFLGYAGYPNTIIGCLFEFTPMVYKALQELFHITMIALQAPRCIYEELVENNNSYGHALQNISLCGRKVLSWSDKISIRDVREASAKHNVSPTELYFSAASATLAELLNEFDGGPVPERMRTFASHVVHDYLLGHTDGGSGPTGHLCVRLPIECVSKKQIANVSQSLQLARTNQTAIYFLFVLQRRFDLLTRILPNVWTVILFNYLSRRFTVSITEISKTGVARYPQRASTVCWGHPIIDAMYFSPPQTNASMSLSVQQFGDHIQLGVMADAQIHPLHLKISDGWARNLQKLFYLPTMQPIQSQ